MLPNINKDYLKSSECNDALAELEKLFNEVSEYYLNSVVKKRLQEQMNELNLQAQTIHINMASMHLSDSSDESKPGGVNESFIVIEEEDN